MQAKTRAAGQILLLPQECILPNKNQPRRHFDPDSLESLAESIRQNGILQPLLVRSLPNGLYELIAGERRLRAARLVGIPYLPCVLLQTTDENSAVYALLENLQRQDLNFFEESEAIRHIMLLYDLSQESLAARLGKSPSTVSNKLRLLRLPEPIRDVIISAGLTERHARALLRLQTESQMQQALQAVLAHNWNVQECEQYIEKLLQTQTLPKKKPIKLFKDIRLFINTLNHAVDTMRSAGIAADAQKMETETYIEYTVRIPKNGGETVSAT